MKNYLDITLQKFHSNKLVAGFLVVAAATLIGTTAVAGASPTYFAVAKPSSASQCNGGTWKTVYQWHRWHRVRVQVFAPNWQKLGFESRQQCVNYVSTSRPTSKRECEQEWWRLGFSSSRDCERYLDLHPGSGYGGNHNGNGDKFHDFGYGW